MDLFSNCPRGTARRSIAAVLAFVVVSSFAACGDDNEGGSASVEYFPPGGVSEEMITAKPEARLNLDNTVVDLLEATGHQNGDTGIGDGVDELPYHFDVPTEVRLSLDRFDEAPTLIALDGSGREIGRVGAGSRDAIIMFSGEHKLRFMHPRAGDPTADPIVIFFRPIRPTPVASPALVGGAQQNPNDVATLMAGEDCFRCDLTGLSWNAYPGVSLAGINLSHADFTSAVLASLTFEPKGSTPVLLTGAIFDGASLSEVMLKGVDLTDAKFAGATFDVTVFDSVTATSADFANSQFENSTFGASKGTASSAQGADFSGVQIVKNSCLSTYDLRGADFTGATFDSTSSVHGTWFAGANLFGATFDGTKFQYDSTLLPDCGQPASCTTVTVDGLCDDCPCTADLGCLELGGETSCVQNQGAVTVSEEPMCERPTVQAAAEGVTLQNADLTDVGFNGADLTNSTFASNTLDDTSSFDGAHLGGVDFTKQDLGKSVDLSGAYLSETTDFTGAGLTDAPASQRGVILSCVSEQGTGGCAFPAETTEFMGADMQYAQLDDAGLFEANLENTILDNASLVGANLNFASLKGASLKGATFGVAPGSGGAATLRGAYMINVDLTDADMRSVDLTDAHLYGAASDALFVRAKLDSANLTGAILAGAVFTDATLTATVFNGAQLANACFDGATLTNAKFDDAYLQGANFSTAKSVTGMSLSNAAVSVSTDSPLTTTMCTLIRPGSWTYTDQNGTPYTYEYGATMLQTDTSVVCPDNEFGPCSTGDSLCPVMSGPYPPVPPCTPVQEYCWENCEMPPCYLDMPDPDTGLCPFVSNCD
jgi:uncharacterized protein YjbI with pentapeptide repeats